MEKNKKNIELPKLARGLGGYDQLDNGKIRYRKPIRIGEKRVVISVTGESLQDVNNKMKTKEKEYNRKQVLAKNTKTIESLQDAMRDWLFTFKQSEVSERTFDRYESLYNTHIEKTDFGREQIKRITTERIQVFLNQLQKHQYTVDNKGNATVKVVEDAELSYSSKKKIYELLDQFFAYYYRNEEYLNPMNGVTRPVPPVDEVQDEELIIYDDDEITEFCNEAKKVYHPGKAGGYKNGMLFIFILWIYCRIGEAMALQWKDINFDEKTVKIYKEVSIVKNRNDSDKKKRVMKLTKTKGRKNRTVIMSQPAIDAIKEFKNRVRPRSEEEYLFDNGCGEITWLSNIESTYNRIVKAAGLEYKNVTIHGLRHTGISYMLRNNVPIEVVSRMAGHQSISVTQEIYYSVLEKQKIKAITDFNKIKFDI